MLTTQLKALLKKEFTLEYRQPATLGALVLYIAGAVLLCYLGFNVKQSTVNPATWNTVFWIIILFSGVTSMAKSFMQERAGRQLYYYTLASPVAIILSKILYNTALMLVISLLGYLSYSVVMRNPVADNGLFLLLTIAGATGFAGTLTMVAAIAGKAGNNGALMPVLSFPLLVPMLLTLIKASRNAIDGLARTESYDELFTLLALNLIVWALSVVLFPFLWRS